MSRPPRVLIVAEHASARFGGEAILPLHYFRLLREREVPAFLLVHERTREELDDVLASERSHVHYVRDTAVHRGLWHLGAKVPGKLVSILAGVTLRLATQLDARVQAMRLIACEGIEVVHQPIPVSPKDPSLMYGLGVPVVIGPMNGGTVYPDAFIDVETRVERAGIALFRHGAHWVHRVLPGKLEATTLLVANERTRAALPRGARGKVALLVENGVDMRVFDAELRRARPVRARTAPFSIVFVGRLVDPKALDIVIEALARVGRPNITLNVLGDGPMRAHWEACAARHEVAERIRFLGFVPQHEIPGWLAAADALVLPSLCECGGAVVLEAMAMGVPVIATAWGGPLDYLDATTGILVAPTDRAALIQGFADGIVRLYEDPDYAQALGQRAQAVVAERFTWSGKITRILEIYTEAIARYRTAARAKGPAPVTPDRFP